MAKGQPPLVWKNGQADPISTSLCLAVRWISRRYCKEVALALGEFWWLSRISPNLAWNSPTVMQLANGHSFSKAEHFPAAPFTASLANGQTLSPKAGQSRLTSSRVTEPGYLRKNKNNCKSCSVNNVDKREHGEFLVYLKFYIYFPTHFAEQLSVQL